MGFTNVFARDHFGCRHVIFTPILSASGLDVTNRPSHAAPAPIAEKRNELSSLQGYLGAGSLTKA